MNETRKPKQASPLSRPLLVALSLCLWLQPLLLPVHFLSGTHSHTGLGGHFHSHGSGCSSDSPHDHEGPPRTGDCFSSEDSHSLDDHVTPDDPGVRPSGGFPVLCAAPHGRVHLPVFAPIRSAPALRLLEWPPEDPPEGSLHSRAPPRFA